MNTDSLRLKYHYASLETFLMMISHKTLRISDIMKSNDAEEISWIGRYIPEAFAAAYNEDTADNLRLMIASAEWKQLVDLVEQAFKVRCQQYVCYVFCLSEESDLLSQWRGYANDGKGVSIGYDVDVLESAIHKVARKAQIDKIKYEETEQIAAVRTVADHLIEEIGASLERGDEYLGAPMLKIIDRQLDQLHSYAITMKNDFFSEEAETRVYCRLLNRDLTHSLGGDNAVSILDSVIRYRTGDQGISSYIDLPFAEFYTDHISPLIRRIYLGPKCDMNEKELRDILMHYKIPVDGDSCIIERSRGSYR